MKRVIEQYASAVIAGMLAIALFMIISQHAYGYDWGITRVLGLILQDSIGEKAIVENGVLEEYIKDTILEVKVKNEYVNVNQETVVSDCFEVKNIHGELQPVYLKNVWDLEWKAIDVRVSTDKKTFCMSEPGVYLVQIFAVDKNEKEHSWIAKVLVNER